VPRSLSMRLPLARTESCGSARPANPVGCAIEHPAVSRRRGGSGESTFAFSLRSIQCHACRTSRLCRLANPFAAAHTSRVVPRSFRLETREGLATARSDTTSIDEVHFDDRHLAMPAAYEVVLGPASREPARLRWFCRHRASPYAPSPRRCRAVFANTVVSARPPFTSAYHIDCGRFSGPDAASRLLQRVFKYDARAHSCERCPRPPQGHALCVLPCTMRFSRCPHHPLFDAKMA